MIHVTAIDIRELPGVEPIRVSALQPGTQFIVGPNAIGKSSLIRALHYLLAGAQPNDPHGIDVRAELVSDDQRWRVERRDARVEWFSDGQSVEPPVLPPPEALASYWLNAADLLTPDDASQTALAQRFRQALAGGIDLDALRRDAHLGDTTFPRTLYGEWQDARTATQTIEQRYVALQAERERLPQLQAEQRAAQAARARVTALDQARALQNELTECQRLEATLAQYPAAAALVQDNEIDQLERLNAQIDRVNETNRTQLSQQAQLQRELDETGLANDWPEATLIPQCRGYLEQLRDAEQDARHIHQTLAQARATEQDKMSALGANASTSTVIAPDFVDAFGDALLDYEQARRAAGRQTDASQGFAPARRWRFALAGISGVAALLATGLSIFYAAFLLGLFSGVAAVANGIAVMLEMRRSSASHPTGETELHAAQARLETLRREQGLESLDYTGLGLMRFAKLVDALEQARDARRHAETTYTEQQQRAMEYRERLYQALSPWCNLSDQDSDALRSQIDGLDERMTHAQARRTQLTALSEQQRQSTERLTALNTEKTERFTRLNLAVDDRSGLEALLEQANDYQKHHTELLQRHYAIEQSKAQLANQPELIEKAQTQTAETLAELREHDARRAEQADALQADISDLNAKLQQAGGDQALSHAITHEQEQQAELLNRRNEIIQAELADWLLGEVEHEYRERNEPRLIAQARERFETFTHQQWSLEIDPDTYAPCARNLKRDRRQPLTALSAGTRMQLLLAAHIAWARDHESRAQGLPLVLDEALSNTDPSRFRAIADNLDTLSREENRQILYLSARREDYALWEHAVEVAPGLIDLGEQREQPPTQAPLAEVPTLASYPAPEPSTSAADYAEQLGVERIDLKASSQVIHIFHLLRDDLWRVHALLQEYGIERLGPLKAWLASPSARQVRLTDRWPDQLDHRVTIATAWFALAQQGHGRLLNRATVYEEGTPKSSKRDEVADLIEPCQGDAKALLTALEQKAVKGLQQKYQTELREHLINQGYLDDRPPLSAEQIEQRLVNELGAQFDSKSIRELSQWLSNGIQNA